MMKPEIRVAGHMWWSQIDYLNDDVSKQFTTANELHIPAGRPVDIQVVTGDVMHSHRSGFVVVMRRILRLTG